MAPAEEPQTEHVTYDQQQDQNLFHSLFGGAQNVSNAVEEVTGEVNPDDMTEEEIMNLLGFPPGATPEESQADAIDTSSELTPEQLHELLGTTPDEEVTGEVNPDDMTEEEIMNLLGFPPD